MKTSFYSSPRSSPQWSVPHHLGFSERSPPIFLAASTAAVKNKQTKAEKKNGSSSTFPSLPKSRITAAPHSQSPTPMSVSCGLECVVCLGCSRWAWKRLTYIGNYDSDSWPPVSSPDDFSPVPRLSRAILAVYEDDLSRPRFAPSPSFYGVDPSSVAKRVDYAQTSGRSPPYIIYTDRAHREVVLAIRGLNLARNSDYKVLLDNRLGMQMFDGGFVHHGLLKAATWVLNRETETLRRLLRECGDGDYRLVFAGHSLGSGVAALMTVIVVNHRDQFGGIARERIKCYALAPARCMSLNLAVKYADVIDSVVLQDDFLPRTPTPLEHIFGSIFCLPCLLFLVCLRDTFIPESRKLKDPRRLYAPGRMYHIVERKFCRCGRFPPEVRTAIPVEGRFEHIVLSCNATSDHGLLWIERESQKALDRMMREASDPTTPPAQQKMERKQTLEKEHMDALQKAVSLNVPYAVAPPEELFVEIAVAADSSEEGHDPPLENSEGEAASGRDSKSSNPPIANKESEAASRRDSKSSRTNWDELVEKLFTRNETGQLILKKDINVSE